jgi:Cu(I)-responsive transcriptional regulator
MNETRDISIGELARTTGTKVVTVRYYEKIGLLPEPARSATNYRAYSQRDLSRLRFIRRCRNLGFTLDQVRELLRLSSEREHDCTEADRIAASHLADVRQKIDDLNRLSRQLQRIAARCRGGGRIADCRIIDALSS